MDADAAFREALSEAMADSDDAEFWSTAYGQPLHIYGRRCDEDEEFGYGYVHEDGDDHGRGRVGPATMTDDEYAAYVRQKMWEKTHEGRLEARELRERARQARQAQEEEVVRAREAKAKKVAQAMVDMEKSLRRAEQRQKKVWATRWAEYADKWKVWNGRADAGMPWPGGYGGRIEAFDKAKSAAVKDFFIHGIGLHEVGRREFRARLKEERLRWHPDKIMQRLGGQPDGIVLRDATAIFQIVDKLWKDVGYVD